MNTKQTEKNNNQPKPNLESTIQQPSKKNTKVQTRHKTEKKEHNLETETEKWLIVW